VSAVDPEADAISYAAYFMRTDLGMSFNVANRTFTWNAPITASDSVYFVRFQVSTFSGGSDYAIARITVADRMPPAAVTDLHPFFGHTTAVVTWTSPGDNGNVGNATAFDLRYSITSIDEGNFSSATPIFTSPPGPPGSPNCAELSGLSPCGAYWFAVKTVDDAGNWSFLSNVPFGQTSCHGSLEYACGGPQQGQHSPQAKVELPKALELGLRGANPTREPVAVSFGIPPDRSGLVLQLAVFDIAGRRLRELRGERSISGRFQANWDLRDHDGRRVPAGLYFLRLGVGADRLTRSILVLN
jgi:hypothetical protein